MSRRGIYAVCTALAVVAFAGSGVANLARVQHVAADMASLGYPAYFMSILGTWKLLGAAAIALPRLPRVKEWAYAGMLFDLTGAAASRAAAGHRPETIVVPLAIACVVVASWWLRPESRKLPLGSAGV